MMYPPRQVPPYRRRCGPGHGQPNEQHSHPGSLSAHKRDGGIVSDNVANGAGMAGQWGDRGSRHERGYGRHWTRLRAYVMHRDAWLCQPCKRAGRLTPAREVDHITPKSEGGTDDGENLQAICFSCHRRKTAAEAHRGRRRATGRKRPEIGLDGWPIGS